MNGGSAPDTASPGEGGVLSPSIDTEPQARPRVTIIALSGAAGWVKGRRGPKGGSPRKGAPGGNRAAAAGSWLGQ